MFGMIHQAAREMTIDLLGVEVWEDIRATVGMAEGEFISAQPNPDERTFALVGAIASRAGLSVDAALRAFGQFWVNYTERSSYASIMRMSGDNLHEFLANLDRMHTSIQMTMPEARMPSFYVRSADADGIELIYQSERSGLEPFVVGLLEGLMERFRQTGVVSHANEADEGVIFTIDYAKAA